MTLKLVLFDCDGTLHNSVGGIALGLQYAFTQHGLDVPNLDTVGRHLARPMPYVIGELLGKHATDTGVQSVLSTYENYMDNKPIGALYQGIPHVLSHLQEHGYLMGIVTGMGGRRLSNLLDTHAIGQYFDAVKHADNAPSKPSPQSLYDMMYQLGIDCADNIVMIGDTITDMQYARAGGASSIGVGWGYDSTTNLSTHGGASQIAHGVDDLLDCIERCIGKP